MSHAYRYNLFSHESPWRCTFPALLRQIKSLEKYLHHCRISVLWHKHLSGFGEQYSGACQLEKTWNQGAIKIDISNGEVNSVFQMHFLEDSSGRGFIHCKWQWLASSLRLPYALLNFNLPSVITNRWGFNGSLSDRLSRHAFAVSVEITATACFAYSSIQCNVWLQLPFPFCCVWRCVISVVDVWGLSFTLVYFELRAAQLSHKAPSWVNRI